MSNKNTTLINAIPKWLFSASFTVIAIILLYLLLSGTKLVLLDKNVQFEQMKTISVFEKRTSIKLGQTQEARVDGFIVMTVIGNRRGQGVGGLEIMAGKNGNTDTRLCAATLSGHPQAQYIAGQRASCTTPIRAGEYYSVNRIGNINSSDYTYDINFVPLK